jgi:hypothetical protein
MWGYVAEWSVDMHNVAEVACGLAIQGALNKAASWKIKASR